MATYTALDIIKRAMRLAGVYSIGEEPSADETTSGLQALNGMIESWANETLMIYVHTSDSIPLVAATGAYTLGASGTVVTTRPIEALDTSYVVYQNVTYPCPALTLDQYNTIPYKLQTATFPWSMWFEPTFPNATITVYPTPTASSTLVFWSKKQLSQFTALTDVVTFPPGYYDALCYNMAVFWCPEFDGASIPKQVVMQAGNLKRMIKRTNTARLPMVIPIFSPNRYVNWRAGV